MCVKVLLVLVNFSFLVRYSHVASASTVSYALKRTSSIILFLFKFECIVAYAEYYFCWSSRYKVELLHFAEATNALGY